MSQKNDILWGLSVAEITQRCDVDLATARRWKRGDTTPPTAALFILARDLGCFDPAWRGWTVRSGELISPEGWTATPGAIRAIPLQQAQIAAYRSENRNLKAALDAIDFEEQPLPGQWEFALEK